MGAMYDRFDQVSQNGNWKEEGPIACKSQALPYIEKFNFIDLPRDGDSTTRLIING